MWKSLCSAADLHPADPSSTRHARFLSQVDAYQRCGWYRHGPTASSSFLTSPPSLTPSSVSVGSTRPLTSQLLRTTRLLHQLWVNACVGDVPSHTLLLIQRLYTAQIEENLKQQQAVAGVAETQLGNVADFQHRTSIPERCRKRLTAHFNFKPSSSFVEQVGKTQGTFTAPCKNTDCAPSHCSHGNHTHMDKKKNYMQGCTDPLFALPIAILISELLVSAHKDPIPIQPVWIRHIVTIPSQNFFRYQNKY